MILQSLLQVISYNKSTTLLQSHKSAQNIVIFGLGFILIFFFFLISLKWFHTTLYTILYSLGDQEKPED